MEMEEKMLILEQYKNLYKINMKPKKIYIKQLAFLKKSL